jgi:hypothetical protein
MIQDMLVFRSWNSHRFAKYSYIHQYDAFYFLVIPRQLFVNIC